MGIGDGGHENVTADEELSIQVGIDLRVAGVVQEQRARDRQAGLSPLVHCVVVDLHHAIAQLDVLATIARDRFPVGVRLLELLVVAVVVVSIPGKERAQLHPAGQELIVGHTPGDTGRHKGLTRNEAIGEGIDSIDGHLGEATYIAAADGHAGETEVEHFRDIDAQEVPRRGGVSGPQCSVALHAGITTPGNNEIAGVWDAAD